MSPAATPPSPVDPKPGSSDRVDGPARFGQLLHTALEERARVSRDPSAILAGGELRPQVLCQYAAGRLEGSERSDLQAFLTRTPWAMGRVSAITRGARASEGNVLAARVLTAAGTGRVDPYREIAVALLESIGEQGALDKDLEHLNDVAPLVKAACLLGHGQRKSAVEAFAPIDSLPTPLAETAKRVAALAEEDEALVELLASI